MNPFQMALGSLPAMAAAVDPAQEEEEQQQGLTAEQTPFGLQPGAQPIDQSTLQGYIDPRRALWGGFMNDMAAHFMNGRRGGFTGRGTQALFGAIRNNQELEDKERQRQILAQQAANPFRSMPEAYQTFQLASADGYKGDFETWMTDFDTARSSRPVKTWVNPEDGMMWYLSSNGKAQSTGVPGDEPGALEIVEVGGVPYVKSTRPGGEVGMVTLDQFQRSYRTELLGSERSTVKSAEQWATVDSAFESEVPVMYEQIEGQLELMRELERRIEAGDFDDSGMLTGEMRAKVDQAIAYLKAENIRNTLATLQTVNLAPVTENELALVGDMFANVSRSPRANLGALQSTIQRMESQLGRMGEQLDFFYNDGGGSLRGYGGRRWIRQKEPESKEPNTDAETDPVEWD